MDCNIMEKSIEQKIVELEEMLQQIIVNSELNVSIVELILRNIYTEIKVLAEENTRNKVNTYMRNKEKLKEEEQSNGNTDEKG